MRAWSKLGHCAQVPFLRGSEAIEANAKETLIERRDCFDRSRRNVGQSDWTLIGNIPRVFSPFLEKVRISSCCGHDLGYRLWVEVDALVFRRFDYSEFCFGRSQGSDRWVVKQSFGVRFCIACQGSQLRQARTDNGQRELALRTTVEREYNSIQILAQYSLIT